MENIYQRIWDADQAGNGVQALSLDSAGTPARGFVKVDTKLVTKGARGSPDSRILAEVSIPPAKMRSYDLARALFDNYALDQQSPEVETAEEREEVHTLLDAIVDSAPMQVAREYVAEATQTTVSKERWYATLLELWFRRFSSTSGTDLSGFEHVFVGEQKGSIVNGYHFWYKYYLDDGLANSIDGASRAFPGLPSDRIAYLGSRAARGEEDFPECVTISFRYDAPDYDRKAIRPLTKPTGGFFVGCSVEGLMAMGTVRAHLAARAPKEAVINGARYELKLYRSPDDKNVRTFYPMYLGAAGTRPGPTPIPPPPGGTATGTGTPAQPPVSTLTGKVRITAALVNPVGDDPGRETVTLQNMGPTSIDLAGWRLVDKNSKHFEISSVVLPGGGAQTIVLPKNSMELSNRGGSIRLVDRTGHSVHAVMYSKAQAQAEGVTIVF